jgi:hypothetical protein
MQIHELTQQRLDEQGILQGIKSAAQGFKQERQQQATQKNLDAVLKKALPAWDKYTQQLKNLTPDPQRYQQLYKQALTAFVQKNLMAGQQLNSAINRQEILKIIDSITAASDNPTEINQRFRMLVQQAALAQPDVEKTSALIRVISTEPAIVQYRNRDYVVGDQGTWVEKQTGKETEESFGRFLDQEWAKVAPESPIRTVPDQKIQYLPADPQWKNLDGVRGFQGKIMFKDKAGKWFDYNNNQPTEETRPEYIDQLNKLYNQVKPAGAGQPQDANTVLQQAGIDTAKLAQLQAAVKADPAVADQLRKALGL